MRIDAHQHFWIYRMEEYPWISLGMKSLQQDFLPSHLLPLLQQNRFDGSVTVQARQSETETHWLLNLASQFSFIKGVVGWTDLCSPDAKHRINSLAANPKLSGLRHVLHDEADPAYMLRTDFMKGLACLEETGLAFDLLIFPEHLPNALKLVKQFPKQNFILDHLGKPKIRTGNISPWKEQIQELATFPNVSCKLSGMVTEADIAHWAPDDFTRYLDVVTACFGPSRLMIGSDWPVCTLGGSYSRIMQIVKDYIGRFPLQEQEKILGENAVRIYRLLE